MSAFNLSARSTFERDRDKLTELIGEVIQRVTAAPDRPVGPALTGVLQVIDHLALPRRLGFNCVPFVERYVEGRRGAIEHYCERAEPFGEKQLRVLLGTTASMPDTERAIARTAMQLMVETAQQWLRALAATIKPDRYPVLPPVWISSLDPDLARDPLYHALVGLGLTIEDDTLMSELSWSAKGLVLPTIAQIHALMRYEGVGDTPLIMWVFEGNGSKERLVIGHPTGGQALVVPLDERGRIDKAARVQMVRQLEFWVDARGDALRAIAPKADNQTAIGEGATLPPQKAKPSRKGLQPVFDSAKEDALLGDYRRSGLSPAEFERQRDLEAGEIAATQARVRSRKGRAKRRKRTS